MMTVESKIALPFRQQTLGLIVSIAIFVGVAGLGGLVTDPKASDWYAPPASLLLVPYLVWVTFAVLLNWMIWRVNA